MKTTRFGFMTHLCLILGFAHIFEITGLVSNKKIICYTATYASGRPGRGAYFLKHLKPELCTHVIFGYAHLNNTSIFVLDNWKDFMKGTKNVAELKQKYSNVTFMVALGGWYDKTEHFSKIAAKSELRKSLAANAVEFLKKYGFDGLDLCWLYPGKRHGNPYDRVSFVELLKELKAQFQPYNYTLSALLSASYDTIDTGYNVKEISETVDFMNMNSYDFNGFWSHSVQPNAPLYSKDRWNVDYAISYMLKLGADSKKIMLGIPFYGRIFISDSHSNNTLKFGDSFNSSLEARSTFIGSYTQDVHGQLSYGEICLLKGEEWPRFWDNASKTPFLVNGDKLISYDDEESIAFKVRYAFHKKLGGISASSLDLDDFLGDCSRNENSDEFPDYLLLRSIGNEIDRYSIEVNEVIDESTKINHAFDLQKYDQYILLIFFIIVLSLY